MNLLSRFLTIVSLTVMPVVGWSDPLPADAKPLTVSSVQGLYSGRTADWGDSKAYFAPDGSVKGVTGGGKTIYWGEWSVKGNEVCMNNSWRDTSSNESGTNSKDCWKWYMAGKDELWTLWSVRYDGTKPPKNDYYRGETSNFKKGDKVSKAFDKLYK